MPDGDQNQNQGGQQGGQNSGGEGGGQQGGDENAYLQFFPEDIRGEKTLTKFKGKDQAEVLGKLAKSYVSLEKWQIPGEGAGEEELKKFRTRMGVPETTAGYTFKPEVPAGVPWSDGVETQIKNMAHRHGLTPKQYEGLVQDWAKLAQQGSDTNTEISAKELREGHEKLKEKWGGNYERTVGLVQRVVDGSSVEGLHDLLEFQVVDGMKLGNHPVMLALLAEVGERSLESGYISGDNLLVKANDAQSQLAAILDDKEHPYWKGDKASVKKVRELRAIANPAGEK